MTNDPNQSNDLRSLIAIGGLAIGLLGLLFGLFRDRWSRRESRLDALGLILEPLVRGAQDLMKANNCRRKFEQLQRSYPAPKPQIIEGVEKKDLIPEQTREVIERVNSMIDEYHELLKSSEKNFRDAEAAYGTHYFRFPTSIAKQTKDLHHTLGEMGRLVNQGFFDKADLQLAKFRGDYDRITTTARGWRLADPFEGLLRYFRREDANEKAPRSEFELTQEEMDGVMELLHKRATTQLENTFAVHPPRNVIDDKTILQSDCVVDELKDSVFSVVFQDGTARMLSLPELMAFVFNLVAVSVQTEELNRMVKAANPNGAREYKVSFSFCMQEIMRPEMVKVLLSKISFSETPSDV